MSEVKVLEGTRGARQVEVALSTRRRNFERCYEPELQTTPELSSRLGFHMSVDREGNVRGADYNWGSLTSHDLTLCTQRWLRSLAFPPHRDDTKYYVEVRYAAAQNVTFAQRTVLKPAAPELADPPSDSLDAVLDGPLLPVLNAIRNENTRTALAEAWRYRVQEPSSVLALVALGQAAASSGDAATAARAYGSIVDLYPSRAEMRRAAGNYLESLRNVGAQVLALDSYEKAREQRPDHPNSHRLYAYALLKQGRHADAFQAMREGRGRSYPDNLFRGVDGVLSEDLCIAASAWQRADPKAGPRIDDLRHKLKLACGTVPSLRVILSWETDVSDLDLHVYDGDGGHAYYGLPELISGGNFGDDVTTGYGPEHFLVEQPRAFPYQVAVRYTTRGGTSVAMGKLQVISHDGQGNLSFDERPFVLIKDHASLHLGSIERDAVIVGQPPAKAI